MIKELKEVRDALAAIDISINFRITTIPERKRGVG